MVVQVEADLVGAFRAAAGDDGGDVSFARTCVLAGVTMAVPSNPYSVGAPDGLDGDGLMDFLDEAADEKGLPDEKALLLRLYLAWKGHALSQAELGWRFQGGKGFREDKSLARYWYAKASEAGDSWAQNALGVMLADGQGGERDAAKAIELFMASASEGNSSAKGNLGEMTMGGRGVRRSYARAAALLKEYLRAYPYSARHHRLLATCYEHGVGGRAGIRLALKHYHDASDFGSIAARADLARLERRMAAEGGGRQGVRKEARRGPRR